MSKFDLSDLLGAQSTAPGGPQVNVTMLPRRQILQNPQNSIYRIGDVATLAEDIRQNGIRQPLEVVQQPGGYLLIGGHRRLAACEQLAEQGDTRFDRLPCIVRQSKGDAEDLLDLITANATARELTDGERLDQYVALKKALEQLKREGKLQGRVADEAARRLGESGGGVRRLNAIANNCTDEVKQMLREGKCGITRAYEASQLPSRKQKGFAETGRVPPTPSITAEQKAAVSHWMLHDSPAVSYLQKLNWANHSEWNYMDAFTTGPNRGSLNYILGLPGGLNAIIGDRSSYVTVSIPDPADETQELHSGSVSWRDLYARAKAKYRTAESREAEKREKEAVDQKRKAKQELEKAYRSAVTDLENWPEKTELPANLALFELPLEDGWKLQALTEPGGVDYLWPRFRLLDGNGEVVPSWGRKGWCNEVEHTYKERILAGYRFEKMRKEAQNDPKRTCRP